MYRLIKPYQSNKVYESTSIMHGAGKCYKELKNKNISCNSFSIIDINSNNIYDFKLNKDNNYNELLLNKTEQKGGNLNSSNVLELKTQIEHLNDRVKLLEDKLLQLHKL